MKIITLFLILFLGSSLYSQFREKQEDSRVLLMKPLNSSQTSLLDMDRFSIDHSFSMSYSNSSKYSFMENEYVSGINYRFSDPLTLRVELAASYIPYSSFSMEDNMKASIYLKSATLNYKPSENVSISLKYSNLRGLRGFNNKLPFEREDKTGNYFINKDYK
ncbi:MAG: hypothetical protein CR982_04430 [Candidatus Cloacimonadota bacterium]|nr:MAG: hypothetical protein CR982_04430 [Candidatus Cloacimonadota bacterium]PIE79479.1 MAG: hypothetical protein CSA15_02980 [Candidatus Delongbacteria bacterium]